MVALDQRNIILGQTAKGRKKSREEWLGREAVFFISMKNKEAVKGLTAAWKLLHPGGKL